MDFSVGDKIRALKNCSSGDIIAGEIYVVTSVDIPGKWVRFIDSTGQANGWSADNFELVTSAQSTPQKYQIGERLQSTATGIFYQIIHFDATIDMYHLQSDAGFNSYYLESDLDKHFTRITTQQTAPPPPKYKKGDLFTHNISKTTYKIFGYDITTNLYHLGSPGAIASHLVYTENELDVEFTLISGTSGSGPSISWNNPFGFAPVILRSGYVSSPSYSATIKFAMDPPLAPIPVKSCDCGGNITYGKDSGPENHAHYCSKFSESSNA